MYSEPIKAAINRQIFHFFPFPAHPFCLRQKPHRKAAIVSWTFLSKNPAVLWIQMSNLRGFGEGLGKRHPHLEFQIHLLLFLSSRLPSCRIPSCWMDGIHAICLSTKKKVVTESLRRRPRRSSSLFFTGHLLVIYVIQIYPYMIPFYILFRVQYSCLNSRYFRNSDKARNLTVHQESLLARAEFHHQNYLENLRRLEVWTHKV